MNSTTLQDVFRSSFSNYSRQRKLPLKHYKAAQAIMSCRTAAQGGHIQKCPLDHESRIQYHSCRHRSCPLCNAVPKEQWVQNQMKRLLPVRHFHLIFTLPHELLPVWRYNQRWMTQNLFAVVADTLMTLSSDGRHLGALPGLLMNIHTWGRNLSLHPHIHCLMTGGGLTEAGEWRETRRAFLFPSRIVRGIYRGKFLAALNAGLGSGKLQLPDTMTESAFQRMLRQLSKQSWHVRIQPPYAHGNGVMKYLARYVKGGPIQNHRIRSSGANSIQFSYRDHRDKSVKTQCLSTEQFMGRVLEHVSESKQHTVRSYGLYGHKSKGKRKCCRETLKVGAEMETTTLKWSDYIDHATEKTLGKCRQCGRRLIRGGVINKNSILKTSGSGYVQQGVEVDVDQRFRLPGKPPDESVWLKKFSPDRRNLTKRYKAMRIFLSFLLVIFPVYGICSDISWDTGYPSWNYWHKDVTEISYETVYEVQEALQTSVIEKLDRVELIQLTLVEAQQLTGMKYESEIEAEPFLVRSIYMHEFTGEYRIYIFEGELLVTHESLGAQIPVSKRGLVVNLAKRPRKIFVTAGTDL